jgi:hypothetical protein
MPEHDKLRAAKERHEAALEFLDWLYDEKRLTLCEWRPERYMSDDGRIGEYVVDEEDGIGRLLFPVPDDREGAFWPMPDGRRGELLPPDRRWYSPEGWYPVVRGDREKGRLLGEYVGVDADAFEREKDVLVAWLQERAAAPVEEE